jgi:N-acetylglucosaminyldiphosphoundecaprenol N-acetyl-beta-D-mannosaminyltransferase
MNQIYIWGIKLNPIRIDDFIEIIESRIKLGSTPIHITGVNPETIVTAQNNPILNKAINESDLVNIDNNFLVLTLRLLGYKIPCRVATPDLFEALLNTSGKKHYRIFILGSKRNILEKAIEKIRADYTGIEIDGHDGFFPIEDEKKIVELIKAFSPDMIFISMPTPYKESFILKNKNIINAKVFLGIGGAIDAKAGIVKRPPLLLRKLGLEGLLRSLQSPLNHGKRAILSYPKFIKIVLKSKNGKKK